MTVEEAEEYLAGYRSTLKSWTMVVAGVSPGDERALFQWLEGGQDRLAEIAIRYPQKGYEVDMLINSRSRSWAGLVQNRPPRPI